MHSSSLFLPLFFPLFSFQNLAICLIVHLHRFNAFYMLFPPSFQAINFIFFARLQSAGGGWEGRLLTFSLLDLLQCPPLQPPSILPLVSHYSSSPSLSPSVSREGDMCSSSWHLLSSSLLVIHTWKAILLRRPYTDLLIIILLPALTLFRVMSHLSLYLYLPKFHKNNFLQSFLIILLMFLLHLVSKYFFNNILLCLHFCLCILC